MGTISKLFRYAVNLGYIVKSPLQGKSKDFHAQESEGNYRYLTREEIEDLLKACDHDMDLQRRIAFSLNTGMDHEDIQRLTWAMVENGQIHTYRSKLVRDDNKKWLVIPINAEVAAILRAIRRNEGIKDKDSVIFKRREIFRSFRSVAKQAKLFSPDPHKKVTFKTLRHTFASHLAMQGRHPKEIADLMGHSSLNMTMRYMHLSPEKKKDAVCSLEGLTSHCTNIAQKTLKASSVKGS
jgi:integrase